MSNEFNATNDVNNGMRSKESIIMMSNSVADYEDLGPIDAFDNEVNRTNMVQEFKGITDRLTVGSKSIDEVSVSEYMADDEIPEIDDNPKAAKDNMPEFANDAASDLGGYSFNGKDIAFDEERLQDCLSCFEKAEWDSLSLSDKKDSIEELGDYVSDAVGLDNKSQIKYYNNPSSGDFGYYSPNDNTLYINEYTLSNENVDLGVNANSEAADTIAHELWHAYQYQCADNPSSDKDYEYKEGFENYIRPEDDFAGYQSQLVEDEARAFAEQIKSRVS